MTPGRAANCLKTKNVPRPLCWNRQKPGLMLRLAKRVFVRLLIINNPRVGKLLNMLLLPKTAHSLRRAGC